VRVDGSWYEKEYSRIVKIYPII